MKLNESKIKHAVSETLLSNGLTFEENLLLHKVNTHLEQTGFSGGLTNVRTLVAGTRDFFTGRELVRKEKCNGRQSVFQGVLYFYVWKFATFPANDQDSPTGTRPTQTRPPG